MTSKKRFHSEINTTKFSNSLYVQFLLAQTSLCLFNLQTKYYCKTFFIDRGLWGKNFSMVYLYLPNLLTYLVDGAQLQTAPTTWTLQYTTSTMLSDERSLFTTHLLVSKFFINSVCKSFPSAVWLERELSDFTGINFLGLVDTRRLLLDYFESKQGWQTHIANDKNYNNLVYDLCLSY